MQAQLELSAKNADQIEVLKVHWQRMRDMEVINDEKFVNGRVALQDWQQSRFSRLHAEIALERAKAGSAIDSRGDVIPAQNPQRGR